MQGSSTSAQPGVLCKGLSGPQGRGGLSTERNPTSLEAVSKAVISTINSRFLGSGQKRHFRLRERQSFWSSDKSPDLGQKTGVLLPAVTNHSSPELDPHQAGDQAGEATNLQGTETKTEIQVLSLFELPLLINQMCQLSPIVFKD